MNIDVHAHIIGPAFYDAIKKIPGVTTVPNRYGTGVLKHGETVTDRDIARAIELAQKL